MRCAGGPETSGDIEEEAGEEGDAERESAASDSVGYPTIGEAGADIEDRLKMLGTPSGEESMGVR